MNRRLTVLPVTAAAGVAVAAGAGLAAGAFTGSSHAPTRLAEPALVKPFTAWGDRALYDLVPGGSFSPQTAAWSLNGGAQIVANSADAGQSGDHALSLNGGASATSAAFPGAHVHTVRFFAQNQGASSSQLAVSATITVGGVQSQVRLGTVRSSSLAPTPVITLPESLQKQITATNANVRINLTPVGHGGRWVVKDVYVDPWLRCGENC